MHDSEEAPQLISRPLNDIERARRARDVAEIERVLAARLELYERWNEEQQRLNVHAKQALVRLLEMTLQGMRDEQSAICRDFLLGLWDGQAYPFNLGRLRRLEIDHWLDCMAVLQLQQSMPVPLHRLVQNGEQLWQQLRRSRVGA